MGVTIWANYNLCDITNPSEWQPAGKGIGIPPNQISALTLPNSSGRLFNRLLDA